MIVGDLLRLEDLHLSLAWGTDELLDRPVTGVTSTDLQDPARYLQPGELVLSGLVWWRPEAEPGAALRFATSLRSAGAVALLAGEGTHGAVPPSLVAACRTHGIPLLAVPAGTSFRAVTDRVYLRLWGDLNRDAGQATALPETVRQELLALLEAGAAPDRVLTRATARLGLPHCTLHTASGRLIATAGPGLGAEARATAGARSGEGAVVGTAVGTGTRSAAGPGAGTGARAGAGVGGILVGGPGASPFDGWYLGTGPAVDRGHPTAAADHGANTSAARSARALAELLAPLTAAARSRDANLRTAAAHLFGLLAAPGTADHDDLSHALARCGLPDDDATATATTAAAAPLTTVAARIDRAPTAWAVSALTELLRLTGARFACGTDERGDAVALVSGEVGALDLPLPRLQSLLGPGQHLRVGVGPAATATVPALRGSLVGARYALASADPYTDAARLDSLAALLAGIPAQVTTAFHDRLLGPLVANDRDNTVSLLDTLASFLDHDCSWSRTAKALHVHVNTVHYRARRIEELTGRDLSRLTDQTDLRTALLCAPRAR